MLQFMETQRGEIRVTTGQGNYQYFILEKSENTGIFPEKNP